MKKKILLRLAIIMLAMLCFVGEAQSQKRMAYRTDYKYDLVSNLQWGIGGIYSNQIFTNQESNIGLDLRVMKRVGENFRFREIAQINGFKCTGTFDRFGKLMTGVSLDFLPWLYAYGDVGAVYNRSNLIKFGLAMDAGLGANIRLSNYSFMYFEVGVDRVQNNQYWASNGQAIAGVVIESGITDYDKKNIQIIENQPKVLEGLQIDNRNKAQQIKEYTKTLDTMNRTLLAANQMIGKLRREILKCEAEKEELQPKSDFPDIYFEYGSSSINDMMWENILIIADIMITNPNDSYILYGYCSNDGQDNINLKLAQDRCYKVMDILERLGVESYRFLKVVPVGKSITWGDGSGTANRFVRIVKK